MFTDEYQGGELDIEVNVAGPIKPSCGHNIYHSDVKVRGVGRDYCCLLDCGSQVCLVRQEVIDEIREAGGELVVDESIIKLVGIEGECENSINCVMLVLDLHGHKSETMPFAVVKDTAIPCCFLLGANYMKENNIEMDFGASVITFKSGLSPVSFIVNSTWTQADAYKFGPISVNEVTSGPVDDIAFADSDPESEDEDRVITVKFIVPEDQLLHMQKGDHTLRRLKSMITKKMPPKQWKVSALKQFKWSASRIHLRNGIKI